MSAPAEPVEDDAALLAAHGVRRLCAGNASPMTAEGTQTYLALADDVALIVDPGPDDAGHRAAILAALGGRAVIAIATTHAHRDHTAGAPALAAAVGGAPLAALGPFGTGQRAAMAARVASGQLSASGGGEGADRAYVPDRLLADGATVATPDGAVGLRAVATPGHLSDHLAYALERPLGQPTGLLMTGDVVMGWSTSVVSPPEGDMTAYFETLDRLAARAAAGADTLYAPGHGPLVRDPARRIADLISHRRAREAAVLATLPGAAAEPAPLDAITRGAYPDVASALLPAAARNALAHLLDLSERGLVAEARGPDGALRFRAAPPAA